MTRKAYTMYFVEYNDDKEPVLEGRQVELNSMGTVFINGSTYHGSGLHWDKASAIVHEIRANAVGVEFAEQVLNKAQRDLDRAKAEWAVLSKQSKQLQALLDEYSEPAEIPKTGDE